MVHRSPAADITPATTPPPPSKFPRDTLPRHLWNEKRSVNQTQAMEGSPCETEYTQEFYRTANQILKGSISICPEFVTSTNAQKKEESIS